MHPVQERNQKEKLECIWKSMDKHDLQDAVRKSWAQTAMQQSGTQMPVLLSAVPNAVLYDSN